MENPVHIRTPDVPARERRWSSRAWILIVAAAFAATGGAALTFEYVDYDDASSLVFHLTGRDYSVQQPFAVYQRGMDLMLSLLPASEPVIRTAAMAGSWAAACLMSILLLGLVFSQAHITEPLRRLFAASVLVLAVPEIFYLGLVYTPVVFGMCSVLGAHLLLRRAASGGSPPGWRVMAPALLLLIFGGLCRWDLFLYPVFIAVDFSLDPRLREAMRNAVSFRSLPWAAAGAAALLVLGGAAYHRDAALLQRIIHWFTFAFSIPRAPDGLGAFAGAHLSVFTPGALLVGGWGLLSLLRNSKDLAFFAAGGLLAALLWPLWFSPKELLIFSPFLVLVLAAGASAVVDSPGRKPVLLLLALLLVAPWIGGIRAQYGGTSYGPGFELRPHGNAADSPSFFEPTLGEGAAIPTREGPRPLFGHAWVLGGGGWRRFVETRGEERRQALLVCAREGLPLLRLEGPMELEVAEAYRMGFRTRDPQYRLELPPGTIWIRSFSDGHRFLLMVQAGIPDWHGAAGTLRRLEDTLGVSRAVVRGAPGAIRRLHMKAPGAMEGLNATTALLDLTAVRMGKGGASE
ncbi:MAG: hypothetical protein WB626_00400 [Bacteroidota bacterium]